MCDIKVSVIVPFYNVELYLEQCLNHLRRQTLKEIEVIMVNDGSEDGSTAIAEGYRDRYEGFRLFTQKNQGAGAARNAGVKYARGKYIMFCDSDDYLREDALEQLYLQAEKDALDMLHFEMCPFEEGEEVDEEIREINVLECRMKNYYNRVFNGKEGLNVMLRTDVYPSPCNMFINREVFLESGVSFYEGIVFEDMLFQFRLYMKLNRIKNIPKIFYCRRVRQGSVMSDSTSARKRFDSLSVCFIEMCRAYEKKEVERYPYIDKYPQFVFNQMIAQLSLIAEQKKLQKSDGNKINAVSRALKSYSGKKTTRMFLMAVMPRVYFFFYKCKRGSRHD